MRKALITGQPKPGPMQPGQQAHIQTLVTQVLEEMEATATDAQLTITDAASFKAGVRLAFARSSHREFEREEYNVDFTYRYPALSITEQIDRLRRLWPEIKRWGACQEFVTDRLPRIPLPENAEAFYAIINHQQLGFANAERQKYAHNEPLYGRLIVELIRRAREQNLATITMQGVDEESLSWLDEQFDYRHQLNQLDPRFPGLYVVGAQLGSHCLGVSPRRSREIFERRTRLSGIQELPLGLFEVLNILIVNGHLAEIEGNDYRRWHRILCPGSVRRSIGSPSRLFCAEIFQYHRQGGGTNRFNEIILNFREDDNGSDDAGSASMFVIS